MGEIVARLQGAAFAEGRGTAQGAAKDAKHNAQLAPTEPVARELGGHILGALGQDERFKALALPRTILPFTFARYGPGMAYGDHLDLPVMGTATGALRTDLSMTVFLSDPSSYDGGDLVLTDPEERLRGAAGDAVVYPSGTVHRVEPVTAGTRLVAITWIQSLVADGGSRAILGDIATVLAAMERDGSAPDQRMALRRAHHALLRRWVRP